MDLMGNAEQFGKRCSGSMVREQEWSNGAVALIGKSYDGSTPWQAAMFGSEHDYSKTIVPISGLIGVKELMWENGSAEARAPIMHNGVYGSWPALTVMKRTTKTLPGLYLGPRHWGQRLHVRFRVAGTYWEERYFLDRCSGELQRQRLPHTGHA